MARRRANGRGRLRIGDHWSAISIIALSQDNPLKAVAEFVENSIDARAKNVEIVRGRRSGKSYLKITDDGEGIPRDNLGRPDFRYVATHICDSIKKQLKRHGAQGIQGEFGIGLLSFWTLGEALTLTSPGEDGTLYEMSMKRNEEGYEVRGSRRTLFGADGTELVVYPLLKGIRQFSGEKLHWYLASELRDRIRETGVNIRIVDRTARKSYTVTPREFDGRLIHELDHPITPMGAIRLELYLDEPSSQRSVALYRKGTRVAELAELDGFLEPAWSSGYVEGIVDAPFLNLTPGTRTGVIRDEAYDRFRRALVPVTEKLDELIAELKRAEDERASERTLRSIRRAFKGAMLALPAEEYDWFDIRRAAGATTGSRPGTAAGAGGDAFEGVEAMAVPEQESAQPDGDTLEPDEPSDCISPVRGAASQRRHLARVIGRRNRAKPQPARRVPRPVGANRGGRAGIRLEYRRGWRTLRDSEHRNRPVLRSGRTGAGTLDRGRNPGRGGLRSLGAGDCDGLADCRAQRLDAAAGTARLFVRECAGAIVALPIRNRAERDRHQ